MTYGQAIKHQKLCDYKTNACRLGCGAKILKMEIEKHEKVCPKFTEICGKCKLSYEPNAPDFSDHVCIRDLKKKRMELQLQDQQLKAELGINYDKVNTKCPSGHPMKMHRGYLRTYMTNVPDARLNR